MERGNSPHRHPWEIARRDLFLGILAGSSRTVAGGSIRVLDVGAGDGWLARGLLPTLPEGSTVTGWDTNYTDGDLESLAGESSGATFVREAPAGRFDLLLLLDVLEHVANDRGFLGALVRERLTPGAEALISVPAWPSLFGRHDRDMRHERRYAPRECRALLHDCGLTPVLAGGAFHSLLPVRALEIAREKLLGPQRGRPIGIGGWAHGRALTRAAVAALRLDGRFSRAAGGLGWSVPGLSWWALCRKES